MPSLCTNCVKCGAAFLVADLLRLNESGFDTSFSSMTRSFDESPLSSYKSSGFNLMRIYCVCKEKFKNLLVNINRSNDI